jgi:hypothetical protein
VDGLLPPVQQSESELQGNWQVPPVQTPPADSVPDPLGLQSESVVQVPSGAGLHSQTLPYLLLVTQYWLQQSVAAAQVAPPRPVSVPEAPQTPLAPIQVPEAG